ncbi:MAG: hypothetical protein QE279_09300 [Rhodoferax sp.]|nr:hypothetical protein [Rhodoferax sp.]
MRHLRFWRDSTGYEVDLLIQTEAGLKPVEIKSGSTYASNWTEGLKKWQALAGAESLKPTLVYGSAQSYEREGLDVWGWRDVALSGV